MSSGENWRPVFFPSIRRLSLQRVTGSRRLWCGAWGECPDCRFLKVVIWLHRRHGILEITWESCRESLENRVENDLRITWEALDNHQTLCNHIGECWIAIDWLKGKMTGTSHISWENLWFPVDVPLSQPIENSIISAHFAAIWPCLDGEVWLPLASGLWQLFCRKHHEL